MTQNANDMFLKNVNDIPRSMNTMSGVSPKNDFSLDMANFGTLQTNPNKNPQIDFLSSKPQAPSQPGSLF
jgi:hypothetical protein